MIIKRGEKYFSQPYISSDGKVIPEREIVPKVRYSACGWLTKEEAEEMKNRGMDINTTVVYVYKNKYYNVKKWEKVYKKLK